MNYTYNLLNSLEVFKKYHLEIDILFKHVQWIDVMTGEIVLTEELINKEWRPIILEQLPDYITDLQFAFTEDSVRVNLVGRMKGLAFTASNDISIETFEFRANSHKLILALHNESVTAEKGLINRILMKIVQTFFMVRLRKTILDQEVGKYPGVTLDHDRNKVLINLERLPQFQKYLELVVMGKPLLDLVEMKLMSVNKKGIRLTLKLLKPPIPSMKDVMGVLGL